jgi:predicted amidophosphoribosyltransferase
MGVAHRDFCHAHSAFCLCGNCLSPFQTVPAGSCDRCNQPGTFDPEFTKVLLVRSRSRPEKHLLRYYERREAVRGAFTIREGRRVDNLRILLLDDVMMTGTTLEACSRALREAGAKSVLCFTTGQAVRSASFFAGDL